MTVLADRVERVKPSFTLEMTSRAAELVSQGVDVIDFSAGQPDFNTPLNIRKAAVKAMDTGKTKYTAGAGTLELREAVSEKLNRENSLKINPNEILISNGEKQSLYLVCQALFQANDEVLIFKPFWVSFPEFVTLSDANPVIVKTLSKKNFEPNIEDLRSKSSNRTKGIIINSPSNPTGSVWSDEATLNVLSLAKENNWVVISDECYERLVYGSEFTSTEKINREHSINATVISCFSLSKTYAMTGWRIGYSAGPSRIIKAMSKIQGQATSCANSIGQKAGIEALTGSQDCVEEMRLAFKKRRDLIVKKLNDIDNINCIKPKGAFYAFPDFSAYLNMQSNGKILKDPFDIAEYILNDARIVTVPGDGFGAPGHVRFSYAVSSSTIENGMDKLKLSLSKLSK